MTKTITKIGNSQGLIFDAALMDLARIKVGDQVLAQDLRCTTWQGAAGLPLALARRWRFGRQGVKRLAALERAGAGLWQELAGLPRRPRATARSAPPGRPCARRCGTARSSATVAPIRLPLAAQTSAGRH